LEGPPVQEGEKRKMEGKGRDPGIRTKKSPPLMGSEREEEKTRKRSAVIPEKDIVDLGGEETCTEGGFVLGFLKGGRAPHHHLKIGWGECRKRKKGVPGNIKTSANRRKKTHSVSKLREHALKKERDACKLGADCWKNTYSTRRTLGGGGGTGGKRQKIMLREG